MSLTDRKLAPSILNLMVVGSALTFLVACQPAEKAVAPEIRPVRVVTVESRGSGDEVALTGRVQAESEVNLAFRIDGRMISRAVNVGDTVTAGQEIARLNPENEENGLRAAEATLQGARGQLIEARANEERNRSLLAQNFISQAAFDRITQVATSAQAQVDAAQAQVGIARNRLGYTRLLADAGGVVTAVGAEPGEVVQGGRMVVQVARKDGRDAVFDVSREVKGQRAGKSGNHRDPGDRSGSDGQGQGARGVATRRPGDRNLRGARRTDRPAGRDATRNHRDRPHAGRGPAGNRDSRVGAGSRRRPVGGVGRQPTGHDGFHARD